jgi:ChrR Cupin-like domain
MATPDSVTWTPAGSGLATAILEGDPQKAGPYALLLRLDPGAWIPDHFHALPKRVIVVSGTLLMRHALASGGAETRRLPAGSLVLVPARQVHAEGADGLLTLLLVGDGPLQTTFLRPP